MVNGKFMSTKSKKADNSAVDSRLSIAAYNRGANYKKLQIEAIKWSILG